MNYDLFSLFTYANSAIYTIVHFFFIHSILRRKRGNLFATIICAIAMILFSTMVYSNYPIFGLNAVLSFFLLILYGIIFLDGTFGEIVLIPAVGVSLQGAVDVFTMVIFALFLGDAFTQFKQSPLFPLIGTLVSCTLFTLLIIMISRQKWCVGMLDSWTQFLLCAIPISCFLMVMLFYKNAMNETINSPFMLTAALAISSISAFSLAVFNKLSRNILSVVDAQVQLQVAKKQLLTQKEMHALYQSMQRIEHEYVNNMIAMKRLFKEKSLKCWVSICMMSSIYRM